MAQMVKRLPTMQETWIRSLGQEDPLEKEVAIHSSTLAWKIPWMEEPGRLQSMGSQRVGHDWATSPHTNKAQSDLPQLKDDHFFPWLSSFLFSLWKIRKGQLLLDCAPLRDLSLIICWLLSQSEPCCPPLTLAMYLSSFLTATGLQFHSPWNSPMCSLKNFFSPCPVPLCPSSSVPCIMFFLYTPFVFALTIFLSSLFYNYIIFHIYHSLNVPFLFFTILVLAVSYILLSIHSPIIHSFNKYTLCPHHMPGIMYTKCWWNFFCPRISLSLPLHALFLHLNFHLIELPDFYCEPTQGLPTMWETRVQSLGQEDLLEKAMAPHSSTLAWKIPWTEEPGRL